MANGSATPTSSNEKSTRLWAATPAAPASAPIIGRDRSRCRAAASHAQPKRTRRASPGRTPTSTGSWSQVFSRCVKVTCADSVLSDG